MERLRRTQPPQKRIGRRLRPMCFGNKPIRRHRPPRLIPRLWSPPRRPPTRLRPPLPRKEACLVLMGWSAPSPWTRSGRIFRSCRSAFRQEGSWYGSTTAPPRSVRNRSSTAYRTITRMRTPTCIAARMNSPRVRPTLTKTRVQPWRNSLGRPTRTTSCSCAARPKASTWLRKAMCAPCSAAEMKSSSPCWSTMRTSCRGR